MLPMVLSFLSSWVEWDHADCFPSVLEPIGLRLAPKQMEDFWRELSPFALEVGTKLLEARNFGGHFFFLFFVGRPIRTFKFQIMIHILILFLISLAKRFLLFGFLTWLIYLMLDRVLEWNLTEYSYRFHIGAYCSEATGLESPCKLSGMGSCWVSSFCFGAKLNFFWLRNGWSVLSVDFFPFSLGMGAKLFPQV